MVNFLKHRDLTYISQFAGLFVTYFYQLSSISDEQDVFSLAAVGERVLIMPCCTFPSTGQYLRKESLALADPRSLRSTI